jgi:hypothetical protein
MTTTLRPPARPRPRLPRGFARSLRECDEVSVLVPGLSYVRVSKQTAADLVRKRGRHLVVDHVPELGLLLLDPVAS